MEADLILRMEDRISGYCGLEARVPFLDHELIETAWSMKFTSFINCGISLSKSK